MIYLLVILSLVFVAVGFILTENNAKYMLSGYNTMTEEERKTVDIKSFIPFFRNFHIFLGLSSLVFGLAIYYFYSKDAVGIFLGIYPILAYIYFVWKSAKYNNTPQTNATKIGVVLLIVVLLFVVGLFALGFKEDKLIIHSEVIQIEGSYSEKILPSEIKSIVLVENLPKITGKTNGFALETIKKGYFKTEAGEKVKLVLNSDQKPIILLTKTDGKQIYFSAKKRVNTEIFEDLKKEFPAFRFK